MSELLPCRLSAALLNCPFCGSADIDPEFSLAERDGQNVYEPGCNSCGAVAPADVWNRRVLTSRLAALERDAERYRWLREQATFGAYPFGDPPAWRWKLPHIPDSQVSGDDFVQFDAAIDSAIDAAATKGSVT